MPRRTFGFMRVVIVVACGVLAGAGSADAATIIINSTSFGWWDSTGSHSAAITNYGTGDDAANNEHRSFFVFPLTGVSGTLQSATLQIFNPAYGSPNPTEILGIFDVSTSIAALTASGSGQIAIYNDLGSGTLFGSTSVSPANNESVVSISLNSAALAALQSALGGDFAVGGALTTLSVPGATEGVFLFSTALTGSRQLVLNTIPEPASLFLLASGLGAIAARRRKTARKAHHAAP